MERVLAARSSLATMAILLSVILPGCVEPLIWDIEPPAAYAGEEVMVVATAPYIPLYPGTIDFLGVPTDITESNWIPVGGAMPFFHYVIVEVPTGVESGCVTIADGMWGTSSCYHFTVLE